MLLSYAVLYFKDGTFVTLSRVKSENNHFWVLLKSSYFQNTLFVIRFVHQLTETFPLCKGVYEIKEHLLSILKNVFDSCKLLQAVTW